MDEMIEQWPEEAGAYLRGVAQRLNADGLAGETQVVLGDAAKVIEDVAVREKKI